MAKVGEIAKIVTAPGKRAEALTVLQRMVDQTKNEPGTEIYVFHEDMSDDVTIWTYELYTDQAARDAHGSSPAMAAIGPALGGLLGGAPELVKLRPMIAKGDTIA
ncbi:MAG: antibiotic biosynthesis monooxygenase [Acidimicrobiales bacterium]|nr:antibiotic biosynthesis monooxygenase [Acidimicrobiales bacterium]